MEPSVSSKSPRLRLAYRGESMRGTFAQGDCLWICPVPFDSLQPGDVVAIDSGHRAVAHRIASRSKEGLWTKGDSSLRRDSAPLTPPRLIGKVMERERRGVRSAVAGGRAGRRRALLLQGVCRLRILLLFPLAPFYRLLRASRLTPLLWRPRIVSARFACAGGELTKFIHRKGTVACWTSQEQRWICRKPYDLILDPPSR